MKAIEKGTEQPQNQWHAQLHWIVMLAATIVGSIVTLGVWRGSTDRAISDNEQRFTREIDQLRVELRSEQKRIDQLMQEPRK